VLRFRTLALALIAAWLVAAVSASGALAASIESANAGVVDFAAPAAIVELRDRLTPYHTPSGSESDGSHWYMLTVVNGAIRPATRVLLAGQPANAGLRLWPLPARPSILQVAASDSQVIVEDARAHGRHAFRVTVPPATTVTLAIRVAYTDIAPSVLAWTEPALVSHNRQMAVFIAAVAGMIAAAMVITLGLAVMTGHPAPLWGSLFLVLIFMLRLAITGTLDAGWSTHVGGPFGLEVALAGLALAVGLKLSDTVVPIESMWPGRQRWLDIATTGVTVLSILSFLGVPGAMVMVDVAVLVGGSAIAVYFVRCGLAGEQAGRVAAPSAAVFALVALGASIAALGGFQDNQAIPTVVGGFTAAGAVLLALAVAAGEGIAILPASRYGTSRQAHPPGVAAPSGDTTSIAQAAPGAATDAIGASHQGVFDLDLRSGVVHLSPEAATLTGISVDAYSMTHAAWVERLHPDDRAIYREAIDSFRSHVGTAFRVEFRVPGESGASPWFELRTTMMGAGAQADRCLGLIADVTARKETDAAIADRPVCDSLTGLGNRVALMEALDRLGGGLAEITFALLDIDRFKSVHASLGDSGADAVLVGVAQRLTGRFGKIAEIFRVRGDAFALVFAQQGLGAAAVGADLVNTCSTPFAHNDRNIFATASVGVAAGRDASDPFDLLKNAELALMQAKRQGGSCARYYTPALAALAPGDSVALEADLRQALHDKQLDVYYQPIVRLSDGTVAGFEALMRWHHPTKGLIEPSSFVAHCEETGLIVAVGRLALERAVEDLAEWQRFFPIEPPLFASVNLSRRQLLDAEFEDLLAAQLAQHCLKPGTLKLEITESVVAHATDTRQVLTRLRAAGASLSIDDFGTGVSNFNQLKDIPFDTLKLDRSFLGREDADSAVILGSIINLAHDLERDVVIEGVETKAEADWMRSLGCEYAQGFYFSAPLPRDEALDFIARHFRMAAGHA
jgi:diguanylate cyclase (GGDEF)-like protein